MRVRTLARALLLAAVLTGLSTGAAAAATRSPSLQPADPAAQAFLVVLWPARIPGAPEPKLGRPLLNFCDEESDPDCAGADSLTATPTRISRPAYCIDENDPGCDREDPSGEEVVLKIARPAYCKDSPEPDCVPEDPSGEGLVLKISRPIYCKAAGDPDCVPEDPSGEELAPKITRPIYCICPPGQDSSCSCLELGSGLSLTVRVDRRVAPPSRLQP